MKGLIALLSPTRWLLLACAVAALVWGYFAWADHQQRIRSTLGVPVTVTSGYRAWAVNKAVGGVTTSDHAQGRAADIVAPRYGTPLQIARALAPLVDVLGIGQLIYERFGSTSWVHVSTRVPDKRVNRVITITSAGTQLGVQEA